MGSELKMSVESKVYSVTELTRQVKFLLEENFHSIWLEGEVSNLRIPSSGHMYFTLKDANSQISAVLFKGNSRDMKFKLKDGLAVTVQGEISLYERSGQYQIVIRKMEPKGLGALQLAFIQLKEKLEGEGFFDSQKKKQIPLLPGKIGIVTSPSGAAIRDMLNVIDRRFSNLHILINPVRVQGEGSGNEIAQAIEEFNQMPDIEVLIIGRGGGSMEDLWAFNEEVVARAIYSSEIPIISAVGHEIDWTISDFVADLRVPTPSAAAELVVKQKSEFVDKIALYQERLKGSLGYLLETLSHRLKYAIESYVFKEPLNRVTQYIQRIDELENRLKKDLSHTVEIQQRHLQGVFAKLEVLNPLSILKRGYSITKKVDKTEILCRADQVQVGELLETKLLEGTLISKVEKIKGVDNG